MGDRRKEGRSLRELARLQAARVDLAGALELGRQAVSVLESTESAWGLAQARELLDELTRAAAQGTPGGKTA